MSAASAKNVASAKSPAPARRARRSVSQLAWNSGGRDRARQRGERDGQTQADREEILLAKGTGYSIFSYLIAGMIAYGGIGWVIGHFTHVEMLFPIGMLVGLAISLSWIIYRYGIKGGGQ